MNARIYFQATEPYFWHWEEGGEVLAIPSGSTIAYRPFIEQVIERLAFAGLPPFGSLLLAIIATNSRGAEDLDKVCDLLLPVYRSHKYAEAELIGAIGFLKRVAALPESIKWGDKRVLLLYTLFAGSHRHLSLRDSEAILGELEAPNWSSRLPDPAAVSMDRVSRDVRVVNLLNRKFPDAETLLQAMAGVPELPEPPPMPRPEPEAPRGKPSGFLEELLEHPRTFHVAALIRQIWGGLSLPLHSAVPSAQPTGGVSDITNKGPIDRLLISEFANDDLLLLSRLANGEALFLNREVPPVHRDLRRVLLIDVSIRNWGAPKVLAYALALAILQHPKSDIACSVYVVGSSARPVFLESVPEVIESLENLDHCLSAHEGIREFLQQTELRNTEVFLLSGPEAIAQPEMSRLLREEAAIRYLLLSDREGAVTLFRNGRQGRKLLQGLRLPLAELWAHPPNGTPTEVNELHSPFPILLPGYGQQRLVLTSGDGYVFVITRNKQLMRLYHRLHEPIAARKGWMLLQSGLPFSPDAAAIGCTTDGAHHLLMFHRQTRRLWLLHLATGEDRKIEFAGEQGSAFDRVLFFDGKFHLFSLQGTHWYYQLDPLHPDRLYLHRNRPSELVQAALQEQQETDNARSRMPFYFAVLKNVHQVGINGNGNLMLNTHELSMHDEIGPRLHPVTSPLRITARREEEGVFVFPNGSRVTVNRGGLILLEEPVEQRSTPICITTNVESAVGMARGAVFAGNEIFFYPEKQHRQPVSADRFWIQYLRPFLHAIENHGA